MIESVLAMAALIPNFRPPAFPLITHDPYLSIWSTTDHPAESWPTHWTGRPHAMCAIVRIDSKPFRILGLQPERVPAMQLKSSNITPTATEYLFEQSGVELRMRFLSPLLPRNLDVLSRPASYIVWTVRSTDGARHRVELCFDMTAEAAVDAVSQAVEMRSREHKGLAITSAGTESQQILGKVGDDRRIDWGHLYVAAVAKTVSNFGIATAELARNAFAKGDRLQYGSSYGGVCSEPWPVSSFIFDFAEVEERPERRHVIVAYDDIASIEYLGTQLPGYWRNENNQGANLPVLAEREFAALERKCKEFDDELMSDMLRFGPEFERIGCLAYRTSIAGSKLVKNKNGEALFFPKENTSNGCIATVDVIYPMLPLYLLVNVELAKASLRPILEYSESLKWKFTFAPHDMGTFPKANGQVYGGGEKTEDNQMPVEESANMLILLAAIAEIEGNAEFARKHLQVIRRWAEYLESKGFDPENQLSTDDFAGHLAHNVNLSAKATVALACYSKICASTGDHEAANKYLNVAKQFAARWVETATEGDHTLLAYDKPGTWSLKYNLVWDDILNLGLFDASTKQKEVEHYRRVAKKYGPALDSRQDYTKLDWVVWIATMSESKEGFDELISPVYRMLNETRSRVPMTDWYMVESGDYRQFMARPVVGAVFMPMLKDRALWKKWADRN